MPYCFALPRSADDPTRSDRSIDGLNLSLCVRASDARSVSIPFWDDECSTKEKQKVLKLGRASMKGWK